MIGKQAIVISELDNLQGIGQVTVGGMEWSARREETGENKPIPVGSVVEIVAVSGVKLIVKPVQLVTPAEKDRRAEDGTDVTWTEDVVWKKYA